MSNFGNNFINAGIAAMKLVKNVKIASNYNNNVQTNAINLQKLYDAWNLAGDEYMHIRWQCCKNQAWTVFWKVWMIFDYWYLNKF